MRGSKEHPLEHATIVTLAPAVEFRGRLVLVVSHRGLLALRRVARPAGMRDPCGNALLPRVRESGNPDSLPYLDFPARPSRNRMTARVNDERRNFGTSYNFQVHQALGNLRTPRRYLNVSRTEIHGKRIELPVA